MPAKRKVKYLCVLACYTRAAVFYWLSIDAAPKHNPFRRVTAHNNVTQLLSGVSAFHIC